jgi:hypothetical protein
MHSESLIGLLFLSKSIYSLNAIHLERNSILGCLSIIGQFPHVFSLQSTSTVICILSHLIQYTIRANSIYSYGLRLQGPNYALLPTLTVGTERTPRPNSVCLLYQPVISSGPRCVSQESK